MCVCNGWMDGWLERCPSVRSSGGPFVCLSVCLPACMRMHVCMHACMILQDYAWMDGWIGLDWIGWMDGWMGDGWMYVRTYVCMYICMHVCTYVCIYVCMYVRMYVCMYIICTCNTILSNSLIKSPPKPLWLLFRSWDPQVTPQVYIQTKRCRV